MLQKTMTQQTITISPGVVLDPQRSTVSSAQPPSHHRVVTLLRAAKGTTAMAQLRGLLPAPQHPLNDDQVLEAIATAVTHGEMQLRVAGVCSPAKRRFFDWLAVPLSKMAKDLNTTPQLMLTLGVKEGGWRTQDMDHNQPLSNPFGLNLIRNGQAAGNMKFNSIEEAISFWINPPRSGPRNYIRNLKTPEAFVDQLLAHGYNTNIAAYRAAYLALYVDVGRAMDACGIHKELPQ